MSYATANDLIAYFDERVIRDLLSDSGEPVASLTGDAKLTAILSSASGEVDRALTVANQYTASDLANLAGSALDGLKEIVCSLAMGKLLRRRPGSDHEETLKGCVEWAENELEKLRKGQRVFGGSEAQKEAGAVGISGPTAVRFQQMGLMRDKTNFFPRRRVYTP